MFSKFKAWFTAARRAAIYKSLIVIIPLLVTLGVLTQEDGNVITQIVVVIFSVLSNVLAASNITPDVPMDIPVDETIVSG